MLHPVFQRTDFTQEWSNLKTNWMNESHPWLSAGGQRGVDCEEIQSLLRLAQFIQVPIRWPGVKTRLYSGTDVWKFGGQDCQRTQTVVRQVHNFVTGGKDHIQKHTYMQTEIPESLHARTITHCPSPPTQGRTSQRPKWVNQFRPRNTTRSPTSSESTSSSFLSTSFLLCSFSLLLFVLSSSFSFLYFFFKLVYRTRRAAACGKELSLLFDDVISVVPQQTFFLWEEKKSQQFHYFLFVLYLSKSFSCFCKWQQKRPAFKCSGRFQSHLNRFLKTSVGELVLPFLPFETADFLENL